MAVPTLNAAGKVKAKAERNEGGNNNRRGEVRGRALKSVRSEICSPTACPTGFLFFLTTTGSGDGGVRGSERVVESVAGDSGGGENLEKNQKDPTPRAPFLSLSLSLSKWRR